MTQVRSSSFRIPEEPVPLKRARCTRFGRFYDPCKAQKQSTGLKIWILRSEGQYIPTYAVPVEIEFVFGIKTPASLSNKKKISLEGTPHSKKPDIDNLVKYYLDVLQPNVISDDAKVTKISSSKIYTQDPYVEVKITPLVDQ